jgi:hypothetical protein
MRRKGIFTLLTAVFMVLAFSAVTFAANQVVLKTTVPNIPKSTCYQAGTDTMEIDSLTQIRDGDVIQFTLNNKVTVCKSINMWLRIATSAGVLSTSADSPVATTAGSVSSAPSGTEWGFLIRATDVDSPAGQIITLTLRLRDATNTLLAPSGTVMTYTGVALTDRLIVKLFDGKTAFTPNSGFFKQAAVPVANVYDTGIIAADNALCIDTLTQDPLNELDQYIQNTPDSLPILTPDTKLNFSGDYRIAHLMAEQTYNLLTCLKAACGNIFLGTGGQAGNTCSAFDFETGSNYCPIANTKNKLIIQSSQPFQLADYTVTMEILVNGVAGEHGVYWSNMALGFGHYATSAAACLGGQLGSLSPTYKNGAGSTVSAAAPITDACAGVAAGQKAVKLTTAAATIVAYGDQFIYFDLPPFNYNLTEVNAGDVVSVKVTLSKATCGALPPLTICIGTFGCSLAPSSGSLLFPYFTNLKADYFWNGIAVINTGSTAGTAIFKAYEKDGSVGTFTTPVAANSMYVNLLENMPWVGTGLGGAQCYITVTTDFAADGFGMISKDETGESMGYLPRK